jgi:SAM-dependent methyltransferase
MGREVDLLINYPRSKRNVEVRGHMKTAEDQRIARQFGRDFFDGDRRHGYGGFNYHPRFWQPVVPTLKEHFGLAMGSSLLDIGCGKGFMLHDLAELIPGMIVKGVDISSYAIDNAIEDMKPHIQVANATDLPFPDKSFDVVISINTIHNLDREECKLSLQEIDRVARKGAFVTVDAYHTDDERKRMLAWNLTGRTIMHADEWKAFFAEAGYTGDYFWFIP